MVLQDCVDPAGHPAALAFVCNRGFGTLPSGDSLSTSTFHSKIRKSHPVTRTLYLLTRTFHFHNTKTVILDLGSAASLKLE